MPPSGQITGQMTPAPVTPSAGHSTAAAPIKNIESIPGHADLLKRQQELERKEAELERRERQMNVSLWVILFINELFKYAYLVSSIILNSFTFSNISRHLNIIWSKNLFKAGGGNVQPNNWPPLPAWFPIKVCFQQFLPGLLRNFHLAMLLSRHIARDPARLPESGALPVLPVDGVLRQSGHQCPR